MSNQPPENNNGDALDCNYLLNTLPNCWGFINENKVTKAEKSSYKRFDKPTGKIYAIAIGPVCCLPKSISDEEDNLDW